MMRLDDGLEHSTKVSSLSWRLWGDDGIPEMHHSRGQGYLAAIVRAAFALHLSSFTGVSLSNQAFHEGGE